jgi:iron complex transport system ATP-binding protein
VIKIEKISIETPRGLKILHETSMQLSNGQLHVVIGPNGSGKTTMLKAMVGLLPSKQGSISYDALTVKNLTPMSIASHISYVGSEHSNPFAYTAEDIILWGRWHHHQGYPTLIDRAAAKNAALSLGIEHILARTFNTLSLGEQKKTHLAKSLCSDVQHYVWDEPLAPLDIRASLELMVLAKTLVRTGRLVVMSLHDISLALRYADTLSILENGKVTWQGLPSDSSCLAAIQKIFGVTIVEHQGAQINIT